MDTPNNQLDTEEPVVDAAVTSLPPAPWQPEVIRTNLFIHSLFFLMALGVIVMSFLMRSEGQTSVYLPGMIVPMPETCASKQLTGYDCPGCGLTRAFISISHGQFERAWRFNAASFVMYPFVAIQIPWNLMQIRLLLKRRRAIQYPPIYFLPVLVVLVLTLNWIWRLSFQLAAP